MLLQSPEAVAKTIIAIFFTLPFDTRQLWHSNFEKICCRKLIIGLLMYCKMVQSLTLLKYKLFYFK